MNSKSLKILISEDGIDISSGNNSDLVDGNYVFIISTYDESFMIENIRCEYLLEGVKKREEIKLANIDVAAETGIGPEQVEELYNEVIKSIPSFRADLVEFPGNNDIMKFTNYFISGITVILSFFELIKNKGNILFYPLELAFPEIDVNINILNKKYYNYFNYYIKTIESDELSEPSISQQRDEFLENESKSESGPYSILSKNNRVLHAPRPVREHGPHRGNRIIIKQFLEYISDYFNIFDSIFNKSDAENIQQDMYCIHASTLGYGMYLEKRIQNFSKKINEMDDIKRKEVSKYYDEGILQLAEKFENLKNEMGSSKEFFNSGIKRSKDEINTHINGIKVKINEDIKNIAQDAHTKHLEIIKSEYSSLHKKTLIELEKHVNNLTASSISKIRSEVSEILDEKLGIITEINKIKNESLSELVEYTSNHSNNIMKTSRKEEEKLSELHTNSIRSLKVEIDNVLKDVQFNIIKSIKEQSKSILEAMFDKILEDFGTAIEKQINKKVDKKFEELKKK